jgi:peptidoglycan-N-acetylglucosamine deacetylase
MRIRFRVPMGKQMRRSARITAVFFTFIAGALAVAQNSPQRQVALTFDDLPKASAPGDPPAGDISQVRASTRALLAALTQHKAPAIGFVNEGKLYADGELGARVEVLRSWLTAGMMLGNHTFSHLDLQNTALARYEDDVVQGEVVTRWLSGARPRYFRFPYNHSGATRDVRDGFRGFLQERGYRLAVFTIENFDYGFNEIYVRARRAGDDALARRLRAAYLDHTDALFPYFEQQSRDLFGREIPQVLLLHANDITADCLSEMLERIAERGYGFVTLDRALADPAYNTPDEYVGNFGISWLHRWKPALGKPLKYADEPDPPKWVLDLSKQRN